MPAGKWLIGNVDYMGFYRTNYDEEMWIRLIDQLKRDHKVSLYHLIYLDSPLTSPSMAFFVINSNTPPFTCKGDI